MELPWQNSCWIRQLIRLDENSKVCWSLNQGKTGSEIDTMSFPTYILCVVYKCVHACGEAIGQCVVSASITLLLIYGTGLSLNLEPIYWLN